MKTSVIRKRGWLLRTLAAVCAAVAAIVGGQAQTPTADDFNPGASDFALSLAVQADGKILVGGTFTNLAGNTRNYIGQLHADGTLDTTFNPGAGGGYGAVSSLALQADGKILVGGNFTTLAGQTRSYIGRLNSGGTLDTTFNPGASDYVSSLAVQADGKILVGGGFTTLGGQPRNRIGRLNSDGTLDTTFNPGASGSVYSLAVQADGKILVGGYFTTLAGQPRNRIGRLNSDGTLDTTFNPGANSDVRSLALQADGKILVGGWFTTLGGQTRNYIGRLNSDGTLDTTFNPGAKQLCVFPCGAGGRQDPGGRLFHDRWAGQTRNRIGRLNSRRYAGHHLQSGRRRRLRSLRVLPCGAGGRQDPGGRRFHDAWAGSRATALAGSTIPTRPRKASSMTARRITWLRGGTSPEVWRTSFDWSTNNGTDWVGLGCRHADQRRLALDRRFGGGQREPPRPGFRLRADSTTAPLGWWRASLVRWSVVSQPVSRTNNAGSDGHLQRAAPGALHP